MLNQRQFEILLELCENPGRYMTASYFSGKQQVSLRTVQNDIKALKNELGQYECLEFQSAAPKGSRIVVQDMDKFSALKDRFYQKFGTVAVNYQGERTNQILLLLLKQHRAMTLYDVETSVFVSRSTLLNDLKRVSEVLQKYNLELMRGSNKVMIDGSEVNKRLCISEENLLAAEDTGLFSRQDSHAPMNRIKDVLVETFVKYKRSVSEVELNNTILQLCVAVWRMQDWFFIDSADLAEAGQNIYPEREIAEIIFQKISAEFHLRVPEAEIDYLTLYMKGRGNYTSSDAITQEIDDLVLDGLREIRSHLGIDLTNDLSLRISLGLHCTPLVVRLQYDMQLKNHLVDYIRQTFPQGFDMATYFAAFLQKRYNKKVNEEEIAFIAIHLYKALTDLQTGTGTKKVLVITSLRRSETILLRQTLCNWFEEQIAELAFVLPSEMNESFLDRYDAFITTEKGNYYDMGLALYINQFPNRQDYLNLKLAMDGFESINDILHIFHRDLFETFHRETDRDDILKILCRKSSSFYQLDGLYEAVMERENLGSTFFGNGIAAAHPIFAVSSDTFVAVGISPQPIDWDTDGNKVHLVMLVNVGKNNSKAFQLWNYLSKIFADRHFTEHLLLDPGYENFLKLLKNAIAEDFETQH